MLDSMQEAVVASPLKGMSLVERRHGSASREPRSPGRTLFTPRDPEVLRGPRALETGKSALAAPALWPQVRIFEINAAPLPSGARSRTPRCTDRGRREVPARFIAMSATSFAPRSPPSRAM